MKDTFREVWTVKVLNGVHNHKKIKYDVGHAYLGRIDKEQANVVATMTRNGISPINILQMLRDKDWKNYTSQKTIYNIRSKIRKKAREGRTMMQDVCNFLDNTTSFVHCRHDERNVVQNVFWAFNKSLSLARCFPSIILMDCTYKTNKYKIPILHIVGVTSTDMLFSVGFPLLCLEREDNYTWALNMIRQAISDQRELICCIVTVREEALMNAVGVVFPKAKNLLRRWHIEKGLVPNLKTKTTS